MTTISSLWLMILIEVLVVTSIVTVFLIAIRVIRNQKDRVAAEKLVQKIKEDSLRRKGETQKLLQRKFGFDEEKAREIASLSGREEKKFYQNTINFYLKRDAASFGNLNIDFEAAVDPYRNLQPPGIGNTAAAPETPIDESEEIKRLKIENKRLSDEVAVTMNTMSRMLDEYSSMFAGGAEEDKEEIKKQMQESLGIEDHEEEDSAPDDAASVDEEMQADDQEEVDEEVMSEFEAEVSGILDSEQDQEAEAEQDDEELMEEMDDLSDLDPVEDEDLETDGKLDNPDELLG